MGCDGGVCRGLRIFSATLTSKSDPMGSLCGILCCVVIWSAFLVAQLVKNPPAMWETWVRSLGWEDPLEKGTATHSSMLAWRIPWTVQSMGSQRVGHDWATFTCFVIWSGLCPSIEKWVRVLKSGSTQPMIQAPCAFLCLCQLPLLSSCLFKLGQCLQAPYSAPASSSSHHKLLLLSPKSEPVTCEPLTFLTLKIYHFACSGVKYVSRRSSYPG